MDPATVAVAGALSSVAALLYRQLLLRAERAEADALYWRERALTQMGLADIATDVAERKRR